MADDASLRGGPRINQILSETSFLYGGNAAFVEELYAQFARDPLTVAPSWRAYFESLHEQPQAIAKAAVEPSWTRTPAPAARPEWLSAIDGLWPAVEAKISKSITDKTPAASSEQIRAATLDSVRAIMMIRAYRIRGHLQANLDPLGLEPRVESAELDPSSYGFADGDYDRPIFLDYVLGLETATLNEIMAVLRRTYCGTLGIQYMHISDPQE
jgi:2-oxoglutarate dehydrogenase E1 component